MNFFGYKLVKEERSQSVEEPAEMPTEIGCFDGLKAPDQSVVTPEGALGLAAVYACVRILSQTVSVLPFHLYEKSEGQRRKRVTSHPCRNLLINPNSYLSRIDVLEFLMVSLALHGNGYARIFRDSKYRPERLQLLAPHEVTPILDEKKDILHYRIKGSEIITSDDILHIKALSTDGYTGRSPIALHRGNLQLAFAAQDYGAKFFTQGANTNGAFTHPGELKDDEYKRLKADLIQRAVGLANSHTPLLLEGGLKYERIGIPPEDAQFIATRKFQKNEIATIYGVPPHMIGDLERSTNNNIEHQGMEFVTYCLMPYITAIESEFGRKLLRYDEYGKFYFRFNLNALLRGDAKTRSEFYNNMNRIGAMSANEARALEELDSYEDGDKFFVQANMSEVLTINKQSENE